MKHLPSLSVFVAFTVLTFVAPAGAQTWTGSSSGSWSNAANWSPAAVPASSQNTVLVFGATTNAAMTNDIGGTFALNETIFNAGDPVYILSGNGLNFQSSSSGTTPQIVTNSANSVTLGTPVALSNNLTVNGAGNLFLNGTIGGTGGLAMAGSGTLTLGNGANTYAGGTNVLNGIVQVTPDGTLGTGNVTGAALGTLSFTGTTATTRSFAMNGGVVTIAAGKTLTFNGSTVSGTYLDGAGTFATNAAQLVNVTTTASAKVNSTNAADQFVHFTNNGAMTVAAGLNTTGTSATVNFNGFTTGGSGSLAIGAASQVNVSNFQTYGLLTIAPATVGSNQETVLKNVGSAPLGFAGGSRTIVGTPATAGSRVAVVDLNGQNGIVQGGLFVNNGYVIDSSNNGTGPGAIIAHYGSLVRGGFFQNPVQTVPGAAFEAGMSASFGALVLGPSGVSNYVFAIDDATGVAGPNPNDGSLTGWGLVKSVKQSVLSTSTSGSFTWTATPSDKLTVALDTIISPSGNDVDTPAPMANFDPSKPYSWSAVQWAGSYSGPADAVDLNASTAFDTSGFLNPMAGTFGWQLDAADQTLSLTYTPTPVPEPGTLGLVGCAGALATIKRRARKPS